MKAFPARIHVLLARDVPHAVVIRRGPARSVCTLHWDLSTDRFEVGQWLRGRIYERRCDLSPDGKHLIYFAMNGRWRGEARGSWTAISRAPYLKAIALFPKGDCWNGGGLFTSKTTYWLNGHGEGYPPLCNTSELRQDRHFNPSGAGNNECLGVYYPRLLRDGWRLVERIKTGFYTSIDLFERPLSHGWVLRKIAQAEIGAPPGRGCYWDEHELFHTDFRWISKHPDWEWAEFHRGRLLWAQNGELWSARVEASGKVEKTRLVDLTPMKFEAIKAPY